MESKPHKCPVCAGTGNVPDGFYNSTNVMDGVLHITTGGTCHQMCRSCGGQGIVFSPNNPSDLSLHDIMDAADRLSEIKPTYMTITTEEHERLMSLSQTAYKEEAAIEEIHDHIKINPDKTDKINFIIYQYNEWSLKHNG